MQNYRVKREISTLSEEYVYEVVEAHYDKDKNVCATQPASSFGLDIDHVEYILKEMQKAFNRPVLELIDGEYLEVE